MTLVRYLVICTFLAFVACNRDPKPASVQGQTVDANATEIRNHMKHYIDSAFKAGLSFNDTTYTADSMYKDARMLAEHFSSDTSMAELLYRAGAIAKGQNKPTKAIGIWGIVTDKYADSKYAAEALFQQAFTFDNDLKDKEMARKYYERFLDKYPNHKLKEDINLLLPMLDKTDEQLILEFEKNIQQK